MLERLARPFRGFADALAGGTDAVFRALRLPGRVLQDFLNGSWLGHSLHAVLVDVVLGAATAAVLLDVLRIFFGVGGLEDATTWVVGLAALAAIGSILTGLTDFKDTNHDTPARDLSAMHGLVNIVGTAALIASTLQRMSGAHAAAFWSLIAGFVILSIGGYIGGHIVYKHGYAVNHNAHARGKRARDFTPVMAAAELPDGTPTKTMFGSTAVMLVRRGDAVYALKETCSHLGGPLSQGELRDDTITCPWHFSTFRLRDGSVVHGPATSRQPRYAARITDGQVELQGPHD